MAILLYLFYGSMHQCDVINYGAIGQFGGVF